VIFQCKTGRSAGGRETELIHNLLPHFVMRDSLASSLFADGFVKFIKVEFLASNLWDFDLGDAFRCPVLF